jgi:hypothetical protein
MIALHNASGRGADNGSLMIASTALAILSDPDFAKPDAMAAFLKLIVPPQESY